MHEEAAESAKQTWPARYHYQLETDIEGSPSGVRTFNQPNIFITSK